MTIAEDGCQREQKPTHETEQKANSHWNTYLWD